LAAIAACIFVCSACRRAFSARCASSLSACRLIVLRLASMSPCLTWPEVRVRSLPPPRTRLDESPEPRPELSSATLSGDWK
jgi:hypothetical protein